MKQTLLFIAPHLSTGGMPQYLYKQIEALYNDYNIYCIEWDNVTGGKLVIQRNRISNLLQNRLITFNENKHRLFTVIKDIKPDVIHLQEIPELFMQDDVAEQLYAPSRNYVLIETSHDSSYNPQQKRFLPDKFLMVSRYQTIEYEKLGIPCDIVEYPIEHKVRTKTREQALRDLGLDPNLKHVINVGLFTPRKNQAEVIEYARMLVNYPIQFHFLGNQADNFKHYWEPLMQNFPSNCKWWNERDDVDAFYEAADLFLFTSRGHETDHETMPLVIREALSWKTPSLIYNLPVYMGYFDQYDTIEYLKNDLQQNAYRIAEKLLRDTPIHITPPKKEITFTSRWDLEEQKVYYSASENIDFPILVSVKEYKSDAVLWCSKFNDMPANIQFWTIPCSPSVHKYKTDPHFMGIKLCVYRQDTEEQLYEMPFIHKFVNIPTSTLSNSIPYHVNYIEYFVKKKYDKWISKPYKLVVDAGANVGVFAKYMLHNNFAENVIEIECDESALRDLHRNFKSDPRVVIIDKALHYSNTPISFYQSDENPVISSTLSPDELKNHNAGIKGNNIRQVNTVTLKDLVNNYGTIDLLKIDIEGAEYGVLMNADDSLFDHIPHIFVECHFFEDDYVTKYTSLLEKLKRLGYVVEEYITNQISSKGNSECIYAYKL